MLKRTKDRSFPGARPVRTWYGTQVPYQVPVTSVIGTEPVGVDSVDKQSTPFGLVENPTQALWCEE
jgi:hypothetical protein